MKTLLSLRAMFVAAVLLLLAPNAAQAQKALVYCPSSESDACSTISAALAGSGAFTLGVDRAYDGTNGTVDLKTVDLFQYSVVFVPSMADNDTDTPYALLRDPAVQARLNAAILGRTALFSGTPDLGTANRSLKDALIVNLATWASANYTSVRGPGLVALQDNSDDQTHQYDWALGITGRQVTTDQAAASYATVRTLTPAGMQILSSGGTQLAYDNMASFGFYFPVGAAGLSMDAVGQTGTSVGGQVVLVTIEGGNTGGAVVKTDKNDYSPGTTVVMTGTGFGPNEQVSLVLHEDPLVDNDRTFTATTDANGSFTFTGFVPEPHDLWVRFILTALGKTSGNRAQTTFTDGNNVKAPVIVTQPSSVLNNGTPANYTLSVDATGNTVANTSVVMSASVPTGVNVSFSPSTFNLSKNDKQSVTMTVTVASSVPSGTYPFDITATSTSAGNPAPTIEVNTFSTQLVVASACVAPGIGQQPQSLTKNVGDQASFSVVGTGTSPFGYQWYKGSVSAGNAIGGATSSTYTINPVGTTDAGNYFVVVSNGCGSATSSPAAVLTVNKLATTLTPATATGTYGGTATLSATLLSGGTAVSGKLVTFTLNGTSVGSASTDATGKATLANASVAGINAGSYPSGVSAAFAMDGSDSKYAGSSGTAALTVTKAPVMVTLTPAELAQTYSASPKTVSYTTSPTGITGVTIAYSQNGQPATPTAAGSYLVTATLSNTNYKLVDGQGADIASVTGTLVIGKATATVTLGSLTQTYTGSPLAATATTNPSGLTVDFTYDGGATAPVNAGSYAVVGTINNANYQGSASGTLAVGQATLTITPDGGKSKTYGQTFTAFTGTVTGLQSDDAGTPTYASSGAGVSASVGQYDVTVANFAFTKGSAANYAIVKNAATNGLTVGTATLTVSATSRSKTYGTALTTADFTGSISGVQNGDAVTLAFSSTGAPASANVGGYPIVPVPQGTAALLANYSVSPTNGTLTVNPAQLTITPAGGKSKIYGQMFSAFTGTVSGLQNSDAGTPTYTSTGAPATAGVGQYDITVDDYSFSTGAATNYTIVKNAATNGLSVGPASLTITPDGSKTKIYGDVFSAFSGTVTGLQNSDAGTASYTSTGAPAAANVGQYDIAATGFSFTTGSAANYTIVNNAANNGLKVQPATLTITPDGSKSKTYGATFTAFTGTVGGLKNSDAGTPAYASTGAAASAGVGQYDITVSGYAFSTGSASNYNIVNNTATNGLTVGKADLTITASSPASVVYGGAIPTISPNFSGFVNGEQSPVLTTQPNCTTTYVVGSGVGSYPTMCSGAAATNYSLKYVDGSFSVTPGSLSVKADDQQKVFDGAVFSPFTVTYSGLIAGDKNADGTPKAGVTSGTLSFSGLGTTSVNAGTYTNGIAPAGLTAANYTLSFTAGTLVIQRATPVFSNLAASSITYGDGSASVSGKLAAGSVIPAGGSVSIAVNGASGTATVQSDGSFSTTISTATFNANASGYSVTYHYDQSTNFEAANDATTKLVVNKRQLTVTPDGSKSKTYGQTFTALSGTVTGLQNADAGTPSYASAGAPAAAGVGQYDISATGYAFSTGVATNYTLVLNTAPNGLTVSPATLTITPDGSKTKTYGALFSGFTGTVSGLQNSDAGDASYVSNGAPASANVGKYDIVANGFSFTTGTAANYTLVKNTATNGLDVKPATLTITPDGSKTKFYGDVFNTFSGTVTGLQNSDAGTASYTSTGAPAAANVGQYDIAATGFSFTTGSAANYTIVNNTANNGLNVNAAPLVITASSPADIQFGAAVPTITAGYQGFKNSETYAVLTTKPACSTPYVVGANIGPYTTSCSGAVGANYSIMYAGGSFNVTPAVVTVSMSTPDPVQYSDSVVFQAKAQAAPTGLAGTVQFKIGATVLGTATLKSDGTASLTYQATLAANTYPVIASFTPSSNNFAKGDSPATTLTVSKETLQIATSTPAAVKVSAPGGTGDVSLAIALSELAEVPATLAGAGNLAYVPGITATLTPVGSGSSYTLPCTLASPSQTSDVAPYSRLNFNCAKTAIPVNTYSVTVSVNTNNYYTAAGDEDVVTVFDPSLGFTTGGGTFAWPGTGERVNFGYTMQYGKNGSNLKGSLLVVRHTKTGSNYRIKSNALDAGGLALSAASATLGTATFTGKSNYIEPGMLTPVGNYTYTIYVEDANEPGTGNDRFWLQVRDSKGGIVGAFSLATGAAANAQTLTGGNIVVPHSGK